MVNGPCPRPVNTKLKVSCNYTEVEILVCLQFLTVSKLDHCDNPLIKYSCFAHLCGLCSSCQIPNGQRLPWVYLHYSQCESDRPKHTVQLPPCKFRKTLSFRFQNFSFVPNFLQLKQIQIQMTFITLELPAPALLLHTFGDSAHSPCPHAALSVVGPPAWLHWSHPSASAPGSLSLLLLYDAPPGQSAACGHGEEQREKTIFNFNSILNFTLS